MAEKLHSRLESSSEELNLDQEIKKNLKRIHEKAVKDGDLKESPGTLKELAERQAVSSKEISVEDTPTGDEASAFGLHQALKNQTYDRSLQRIQSRLSKPEKALSKLIHRPIVDKVSAATGKTLVRPSGVLGGGLLALAGSSYLLISSNHFGFHYNYFVFFILFAIGFVLGTLAELIIKLARK
jgi:hypothetical protein